MGGQSTRVAMRRVDRPTIDSGKESGLIMPSVRIVAGVAISALACAGLAIAFWSRSSSQVLSVAGLVEIQEVRLGSKQGGRVAEVLVREGEIAQAGQLLVRFETPEFEAQRVQLQGRVASTAADLDKARNGPRVEDIRQAESDLESAQADLKLAEEDLERSKQLYQQGTIPRADYDSAQAARMRTHGKMASAAAHLDLLRAGTRVEDIALAEANHLEARGRLQEIEAYLAEARVLAPERCFVEVVSVRKGDLVPPNQPVLRVLRTDDLWVRAYVPETQLGKIRQNQSVLVTMDAYPGRQFHGTVFQISSESEFTPRNIQSVDERRHQVFGMKIRVDDAEGIFKSGLSATVKFDLN